MVKLYGFKKESDMVKDTDTISEMYDERKKREEQAVQELCKAAKEFDEEKKRERGRLIATLDRLKVEALFAYDMGGTISFTRSDKQLGLTVTSKPWNSVIFTQKLQYGEEGKCPHTD